MAKHRKSQARNAPFGRPAKDKKTRGKRKRGTAERVLLYAAAAVFLLAPPVHAQDINDTVTIEDLGLTQRLHAGARPAGMAGAYSAIGDDTHSLIYNPAGLARVRRVEFGIGFQQQRSDLTNRFFGTRSAVEVTNTALDYISAAYPVPTYRGSLVLAAGVYRTFSSDIDILNRGFNTTTSTDDDYRLQQSGSIFSYNFGVGVDLAPNLSIGANLFIMDGRIKALTQFSYAFQPPFNDGEFQSESLIDAAEVDLDGIGATVGFQFHAHRTLHFGASVTTPTRINLSGDAIQEDALYFFNSPDSFYTDAFLIEVDYQLPFRVDAGVSVSLLNFLFSADVGYADWTQATINGVRIKDQNLRAIFREVVELRGGVEFKVPLMPLRVRGGYAYLPYPLKFLQPDRIDSGSDIEEAQIETERQMVSAGFGVLLGRVLTIDAGAEYHIGHRVIPTLDDKREMYRLTLSTSYRF